MPQLRNRMTVPSGMLHPAGVVETPINPAVQATARPAGSLLLPSPGYDSIRPPKNRFQGRGPSGGFRPSLFAEDVGGTGAALSVIPGDVGEVLGSEWLPEEGDFIVADRGGVQDPEPASTLHEGYLTIPDMGDRTPERPLSRSRWLHNPVNVIREDYRRSPAMTVLGAAAMLTLLHIVASDAERRYRGYRGRGVTGAVAAAPTAAVATGGDVATESVATISKAAEDAAREIQKAGEEAVTAVKDAGQEAVSAIKSTVE